MFSRSDTSHPAPFLSCLSCRCFSWPVVLWGGSKQLLLCLADIHIIQHIVGVHVFILPLFKFACSDDICPVSVPCLHLAQIIVRILCLSAALQRSWSTGQLCTVYLLSLIHFFNWFTFEVLVNKSNPGFPIFSQSIPSKEIYFKLKFNVNVLLSVLP